MLQENPLNWLRRYFAAGYVYLVAQASAQENLAAADFSQVAAAKAALAQTGFGRRPIRFGHRGAAHFQAAVAAGGEADVAQWRAGARGVVAGRVSRIVGDSTTLAGPVEIVHFQAALLEDLLFKGK